MQKVKQFFENNGFSSQEMKVALFLSAIIVAGAVFKYTDFFQNEGHVKLFNYAKQDSLFYSAEKNDKISYEINDNKEKKVDYEQELLDFTDDNLSKRDNKLPELYEKSVDINTADKETLVLLPSIGEKTAEKIIEYRSQNGNFKQIEEIQNVKGIGPAKFEKIKKYIDVKIKEKPPEEK
ncbi:MAG: helix-hairpin-helix domain-containing protein [Ignavibacteria bacterium]|nr:helix-hairpin-helix domain-containing protein [Ignavibacteria bacterium]